MKATLYLILLAFVLFLFQTFGFTQCYNGDWSVVGPKGMPGYKDPLGSVSTKGWGLGRVYQVLCDPTSNDIVYIASASGGLWKRDASGGSPIVSNLNTDFLERIGIAKVAIDPVNNNVIYIGTGSIEHAVFPFDMRFTSSGIYKSTDGGGSWNSILSWQTITGLSTYENLHLQVAKILINPTNHNQILVAVRNLTNESLPTSDWGKLYRSTNGGSTWSEITSNLDDRWFWDMEYLPGEPNTVFLSSHKVYKSTDFGLTWVDKTSSLAGLDCPSIKNSYLLLTVAPNGSLSPQNEYLGILSFNEYTDNGDLFVSTDKLATTVAAETESTELNDAILQDKFKYGFAVNYNFTQFYLGGVVFRKCIYPPAPSGLAYYRKT